MAEAADLSGVEVALTGRFASMPQQQLAEALEAAGGRHVATPGPDTHLLVVGRGGPPLGEDGRLTASLARARRLRAAGTGIAIVDEEDFLARLGRADLGEDLRRLYTASQMSRILGVPVSRLRAWTRAGLIRPVRAVGRLCWYGFSQVATARTLVQLTARGVTPARLHRSLARLERWLGRDQEGLSQLEVLQRGGPLLVRLADGRLAEPTGQLRLGFEGRVASSPTIALAEAGPPTETPGTRAAETLAEAAHLFEQGIDHEQAGRLAEAVAAYERSLTVGGSDAETCFNLGNALYGLGRRTEAARRFSEASGLEPDFAEAWNNLGNVLAELGRIEEALRAYGRALALLPDYADVHYNLAETLAAQGDAAGARQHWQAYLAREPQGESAERVRRRLQEPD